MIILASIGIFLLPGCKARKTSSGVLDESSGYLPKNIDDDVARINLETMNPFGVINQDPPTSIGAYYRAAIQEPAADAKFSKPFKYVWPLFKALHKVKQDGKQTIVKARDYDVTLFIAALPTPDVSVETEKKNGKYNMHQRFVKPAALPPADQVKDPLSAEFEAAISKSCSMEDPTAGQSPYPRTFALHYNLGTLDTPELVRNFLTLARIGYFDETPLAAIASYRSIIYFGQSLVERTPFFRLTNFSDQDPLLKRKSLDQPAKNDNKNNTGGDLPVDPDFKDIPADPTQEAQIPYGSLLGMISKVHKVERTRDVDGLRIGISASKTRKEERDLEEQALLPAVFAILADDSRAQFTEFRNYAYQQNENRDITSSGAFRYLLKCVEIKPKELTVWYPK